MEYIIIKYIYQHTESHSAKKSMPKEYNRLATISSICLLELAQDLR